MSFEIERLDRRAVLSALAAGTGRHALLELDPNVDEGLICVSCFLPGCREGHTNDDADPSALFSPQTGRYECQSGHRRKAKGWRELVETVLGPDRWKELTRCCWTDGPPGSRDKKSVEGLWAGLQEEHRWTDLYRIDPELSARYLRAGRPFDGEIFADSALGLRDAAGKIVGVKFRLPPGREWARPPRGGGAKAKYRAADGSQLAGVAFLGDRAAGDAAATIVITAGEKDALVAASHLDRARWAPISSCVGEQGGRVNKAWAAVSRKVCQGREVVICYDPDETGRCGAWLLAQTLSGVASSVRVAVMPEDRDGLPAGETRWDVAGLVLARGVAALERVLEAAGPAPEAWKPADAGKEARGAGGGGPRHEAGEDDAGGQASLPTIVVTARLHETVDASEAALADAQADVYHRTGELVHVVPTETGPTIRPVRIPALRDMCSRSARWVRMEDAGEGEWEEKPIQPPKAEIEALAARGSWPRLRYLAGVVEVPTLRRDGSVLEDAGHDAATGLLYLPRPGIVWPRVPEKPTRDEARAALDFLGTPLADFPWRTPADRAAALSVSLTLLGRPAIGGPVPAVVVDATEAGTGKGLLVDIWSLIVFGRGAGFAAPPSNDDEERKLLHAWAREGRAMGVFDNLEGMLGSEALNSAVTSGYVDGRTLNFSATGGGPCPLIVATGNNVRVRNDMARRCLLVGLDAGVERPDLRTEFRLGGEDDLRNWVIGHRAELVTAALTVLRWFALEGCPPADVPPIGSFGSWARLVRGALIYLGAGDPVASQGRIFAAGDPQREAERELYRLWRGDYALSAAGVTARALIDRAGDVQQLRDVLYTLDPRASKDGLTVIRVARLLGRLEGRIRGGLRLVRDGRANVGVVYRLESATDADEHRASPNQHETNTSQDESPF